MKSARTNVVAALVAAGLLTSGGRASADPSTASAEPAALAPLPEPSPAPVVDADRGAAMRRAGWITAGAGIASIAGAALLFAVAAQKREGLRDGATADGVDSYNGLQRGGAVLAVAGALAAATGLSLVLLAPKTEPLPGVALGLQPGQVTLLGRF